MQVGCPSTARARSRAVSDLAHVVAVDDLGLPAEGGELAVDRVEIEHFFGGAGLLVVVAVDDQGQVIEPELGRGRGRLPILPLVELAVAGQNIRVIALLVDAGGQGMADADATALAERAGRGLDAAQDASCSGCPSSGLPSLRRVMISSWGK